MIITTAQPAVQAFSNQQFSSQHQHSLNEAETEQGDNSASLKDSDTAPRSNEVLDKSKQQTPQELRKLERLKARDTEVRTHERAHLYAAGSIIVSGASFTFVTGSDGKRYAVSGEVSIDTSPVSDDPAATLKKADTIRRAALAPMNPSATDQQVAAQAAIMASEARVEMQQERLDQDKSLDSKNEPDETTEDQQKPTEEVIDLIV